MTQKQLKTLIAAGVFSAALMSGKAYADPSSSDNTPPTGKKGHHKHLKGHSCKGMNSCKGKGGCKTGDAGCAGKNSCKGKGGCKTGDYKAKADEAPSAATPSDKNSCKGMNSCKGKGGCKTGDAGCAGKNSCKGKGGCATDGSHK